MLQKEILLDVVGTSGYHCGVLQSFLVEILSRYQVIMAPKKITTPMTDAQIRALISQGVVDALAERELIEARMAMKVIIRERVVEGQNKLLNEVCFHISNCEIENQVKFATCTLHSVALTWWNTHVNIVGHDAAYEIWDLKVKGTDLTSYTQRFQELDLLCGRMFPEESDKIENYVSSLPDMIHRNVMASKPKTMQDAIEIATELMDKKISTLAECQAENKRKLDNNNQAQQQPPKKQGVAIAYTAGSGERKEYAGTLPLCNKSLAATNNKRNPTCYECGNQGHYKSDCPKLKTKTMETKLEVLKHVEWCMP
ncbi:reverse transcriptase domain-containing protein [Tanacetum coccineum]